MLRWLAAAIAALGTVCGITFAILGKDALAVVSLGLVVFGLVLFFVGLSRNQT